MFIGIIFGTYLFFKGFKELRFKRHIENIPTSKIRSMAMGEVEIKGEALPIDSSEIIRSPFTNRECVYYRYTTEEYVRSGKYGHWTTMRDETTKNLFYLKDDTASVLIDPKGAEVDIPARYTADSSCGQDPPEEAKKFLMSEGISYEGLLGINKRMRYREYYITPSEMLYVMGEAADNPYFKDGYAVQGIEDVVIKKGRGRYYISKRSEKEILKLLSSGCRIKIFGGPAIVIGCLTLIILCWNL
jgi:hypothetical protein